MKHRFFMYIVSLYTLSVIMFSALYINEVKFSLTEKNLGILCLSGVYPGYTLIDEEDYSEKELVAKEPEIKEEESVTEKQTEDEQNVQAQVSIADKAPRVLIVHTHATETYLPTSSGNYHSVKVKNSVREVGQVIKGVLEEEGIAVIHDQTLHDNPSYSSSYGRSYETVDALVKKYPSIELVIDLHRDAIASDVAGDTVSVGGKNCARYMYVMGNLAPNYGTNLSFVEDLNDIALEEFDGFTGKVLGRDYEYNQGLAKNCILLEIGNNRNQIEEARGAAEVVGKIIATKLNES